MRFSSYARRTWNRESEIVCGTGLYDAIVLSAPEVFGAGRQARTKANTAKRRTAERAVIPQCTCAGSFKRLFGIRCTILPAPPERIKAARRFQERQASKGLDDARARLRSAADPRRVPAAPTGPRITAGASGSPPSSGGAPASPSTQPAPISPTRLRTAISPRAAPPSASRDSARGRSRDRSWRSAGRNARAWRRSRSGLPG